MNSRTTKERSKTRRGQYRLVNSGKNSLLVGNEVSYILYNYQKGPLPIMFLIITKVLCRLCSCIGHGLKKAITKRLAVFKEEGRSKRQEDPKRRII